MQKFVRPPKPDWYDENATLSEAQKQEIIQELLKATGNCCAYTGENATEFDGNFELDMFVPNNKNWDNLYVVSPAANRIKRHTIPNEFILRPDAEDYDFDKYFELDFKTGYLNPKNGENYKYAVETIAFFGLNYPDLARLRWITIENIIKIEFVLYRFRVENKNRFLFPFVFDKIIELQNIEKGYIDSIQIEFYHCIQYLYLDNLGDKKEVYFLGENGDGKTLLLQALCLAFSKKVLKLANVFGKNPILKAENAAEYLKLADFGYKTIARKKTIKGFSNLANLYAYGVYRSNKAARNDIGTGLGFSTLFANNEPVISFEQWLIKLKANESESDYRGFKSQQAIELFENLLDGNVKIEAKGDIVSFWERGFKLEFDQLSEGYRSVLSWVTDLLARLCNDQPDSEKNPIPYEDGSVGYDFEAVVLVDEVNLHLHPKWEYQIVRKLRKWFPNIQFFFTTHSPVMVLGASEDAVFYRLYKNEEGITQISEPYLATAMGDWLANILITSPLFGLDSARAAFRGKDDESDTADDSLSSQIRKTVREEVARLKKEKGTSYFSRETLQALIDKALQNARQKP